MERVHYRRYSPSRLHETNQQRPELPVSYKNGTGTPSGFREKLIVQGIISAIILAVVLALNIVDNPQAINIRNNLNQAISGHITAEQVADEVNNFLTEGPLTALPFLLPAQLEHMEAVPMQEQTLTQDLPTQEQLTHEYPAQDYPTAILAGDTADDATTTTRIDEDILRETLGLEGDDLQTTAPEPIILPEL